MWISKEFIEQLNWTIENFSKVDFSQIVLGFEKFGSKKYQSIIENFGILKEQGNTSVSLAKNISDWNVSEVDAATDDQNQLNTSLIDIARNIKSLNQDVGLFSQSICSLNFKTRITTRHNRSEFDDSINSMARVLEENYTYVENQKKISAQRITELEKICEEQSNIIESVIDFTEKTISGDFQDRFPAQKKFNRVEMSMNEIATKIDKLQIILQKSKTKQQKLESNIKELTDYQSKIANYLDSFAKGNYSQTLPQSKESDGISRSLSQIQALIDMVVECVTNIIKGELQKDSLLLTRKDVLGSAFNQLHLSLNTKNEQFTAALKNSFNEKEDLKSQQNELLEYNLEFEQKFQNLADAYERILKEKEENQKERELLTKRLRSAEKEKNNSIKDNLVLTKQKKFLTQEKTKLTKLSKTNTELWSTLLSELERSLLSLTEEAENLFSTLIDVKNPDIEKHVENILKQIKQIHNFTKIITDDSHKRSKLSVLNVDEFDLQNFLKNLQHHFQAIAFEKGLTLNFSIEENVAVKVIADESRINRILSNLLHNICQSTEKGSIQCRVFQDAEPDSSSEGDLQPRIGFEIKNDGESTLISGHDIVLEAFKGDYSIKKGKSSDIGLGLAILRELASILEGELHLHSIHGEGDTYLLLIPVEHTTLLQQNAEKAKKIILPGEKVFLLLDKEDAKNESFTRHIQQKKYHCLSINSPESIKQLSDEYSLLALFLSTSWSNEEGFIEKINQWVKPKNVPIYAITDQADLPGQWKNQAIGKIGINPSSNDIESAIKRVEHFNLIQQTEIYVVSNDQAFENKIQLAAENLEALLTISSYADESTHSSEQSHLVGIFNLGSKDVSQGDLLDKIDEFRKTSADSPLIVCLKNEPGNNLQNSLNQRADAILWGDKAYSDSSIAELILFLNYIEDLTFEDRRKKVEFFQKKRDQLLKQKKVLMITHDVSETLAIRKQLIQQEVDVRVTQQDKDFKSIITGYPECDLVILDMQLSANQSSNMANDIHMIKKTIDVPFIMMNRNHQFGDRQFWISTGIDGYLIQPVDFQYLLSTTRVQFEIVKY